jgi:hypothetical protein
VVKSRVNVAINDHACVAIPAAKVTACCSAIPTSKVARFETHPS